jgi:ectoine hydroxylase-related dioxygenase (phytanoyl-CoA dioxygenase family)
VLDADVRFFEANGFAGPYRLTDQEPVEQFADFVSSQPRRGRLNWALAKLRLTRDLRLDQRHGHIAFGSVYELATRPQLLDDVEALLGPDLLLWKGRIMDRGPGDRGQGWHIDRDNKLLNGVHISVAITEMTAEKGAVQLIPRTHKYDVSLQEHRRRGDCDLHDSASVLALANRTHPENAPHKIVTMAIKSGEYYLTRGGLWHGVLPNRSRDARVALIARYMRPDIRSHHWSHDDAAIKVVNRRSLPCILVRGVDNHHFNDLHAPPGDRVQR